MNKYQREKAKRMKKLANLGIGYYQQKSLLKKYSPEQLDLIIEHSNKIKNLNIAKKITETFKRVGYMWIEFFKKYKKDMKEGNKG